MSSRALILASLLLFVNGCDYSQKKPQVVPGAVDLAAERSGVLAVAPFDRPVLQSSQSCVIESQRI
jgi:hypothetical protein